ncbi:hypothetical protein GWI33_004607 [Rhynchophorus ferrugineus]|uniref:Secreted protein n=1 Tax=Rhynchophorus ferrugineus TaxID=354439 RepID=A0A834IUZ6_RHYFE|nr:hypothetical protein GWI33_004607 [Rhynchophorus ferrugineus]
MRKTNNFQSVFYVLVGVHVTQQLHATDPPPDNLRRPFRRPLALGKASILRWSVLIGPCDTWALLGDDLAPSGCRCYGDDGDGQPVTSAGVVWVERPRVGGRGVRIGRDMRRDGCVVGMYWRKLMGYLLNGYVDR